MGSQQRVSFFTVDLLYMLPSTRYCVASEMQLFSIVVEIKKFSKVLHLLWCLEPDTIPLLESNSS